MPTCRPIALSALLLLLACPEVEEPAPPRCDGVQQADEATVDAPFDADGDGAFDPDDAGCAATYEALDCDDADPARNLRDEDGDGVTTCAGDCDDALPSVFPGAEEACDGEDNDCDGATDEEAPTWYADGDEDGFGDPEAPAQACDRPPGHVADATDCDDRDDSVHPGADETWDDGIDRNCVDDPPRALLVTISPDPLRTASTPRAHAIGQDAEGAAVVFRYAWTVDGTLVPGAIGDTLPSTRTQKGSRVQVTVVPSDGALEGEPLASAEAVVLNTMPTLAEVTISPDPAFTTSTLAALPAGWADADGDAEGTHYAWTVDGFPAGGDAPTLAPSAFSAGDQVMVTVTPDDGEDAGLPVSSAPLTISNSPPTAPVVSISPDLPTLYEDLLCAVDVESSDADGDPVTYGYAWLHNGGSAGNSTDTVAAASLASGDTWTCEVTPSDGSLAGPAGSASLTVLTADPLLPTGADQSFTVPAGVTELFVKLWGAAGGGSDAEGLQFPGGPGGYAEGVLSVTPGEVLTVKVGQGGLISSAGFSNAYPNGGMAGFRSGYHQGGGGGRSAIERADGTELIVAGAGGGAGCTGWAWQGVTLSTAGGAGGDTEGTEGLYTTDASGSTGGPDCAGDPGTQTAGGAESGLSGPCGGSTGNPGAKNQGGDGLDFPSAGNCGGGGGDGWYGGAAGALHAGGGGGSGYLHPTDVTDGLLAGGVSGGSPPETADPDYVSGVGQGAANASGGGGLVVIWW